MNSSCSRFKKELIYGRHDTKNDNDRYQEYSLAIFHELFEQSQNLFSEWRAAADGKKEEVL